MTKTTTANYLSIAAPGNSFNQRISADSDIFARNDIDALGAALDLHDHTSGKGLAVGALATTVTLTGLTTIGGAAVTISGGALTISTGGITISAGTPALTLPAQSGGVAKAITWGDAGAGVTSILGNTVGGSPGTNVLRFDIANGNAAGSVTALTLDGTGKVTSGVGGFDSGSGTDVAGGGATATLPTIGGTGPTTAACQGWMRIKISGFARWVPFWL